MSNAARSPAVERLAIPSRGDLVHVRVTPAGGSPRPLVIVTGPDGAGHGPHVDACFEALGAWAVVAAIDLPLCGDRHSDKLSEAAFDPDSTISTRLAPDVERQIQSDLERALERLREREGVDANRVALCAFGLGARLVRRFCDSSSDLAAHVLLEEPDAKLADQLLRDRLF